MYFLEMILAFFVLFGIALFFVCIFRVNTGEGMFLSVSLAIEMLFVGSSLGSFIYGVYGLSVVAVLGVVIWCVKKFYFRKMEGVIVFSPVFIGMLILYLLSLVLLYNDFIQHIDELHHWAATVKFMLNSDRMPVGISTSNYAYATSLFLLYFQKFTGYSEQGMYVASFLLMWIGFLLPFSGYEWKNWKKVFIYIFIVYFSLFSLYLYGTKSLYVDVPVAAWAGGLIGWWMNREKKKTDYLIAATGLVMIHFFKASSGLLVSVFVFLFFILQTRVIESGFINNKKHMNKLIVGTGVLCVLVITGSIILLGISMSITPASEKSVDNEDILLEENKAEQDQCWMVAGVELPEPICRTINSVGLSRDKVMETLGAFATKSFGAPLSSRSNWNLAFFPFIFIILILWKVCGDLYGQHQKYRVYMLYTMFVMLCYSMILLFSFLFMFAYELSIELRSSSRYFSTCAIFLFVPVLVELLKRKGARKETVRQYVVLGITVFFVLGLNEKFIPNATAIDKDSTAGYTKLSSMAEQIRKLDRIIDENDRIYYICQYSASNLAGAELYNASLSYYLGDRVSNYLDTPWKFTETGCNIRLEKFDTMLSELPSLLAQGGYTYLWVHTTDKYLTKELPKVLECSEVKDGNLYKVVYENGTAKGLELVQNLQN